jgi:hypothetical protein
VDQHATVDVDRLAGDVVRVARREEDGQPRDVVGSRQPAHEDAGPELLERLTRTLGLADVEELLVELLDIGVSTTPGQNALAVILSPARARAPAWVRPITANLLAQ